MSQLSGPECHWPWCPLPTLCSERTLSSIPRGLCVTTNISIASHFGQGKDSVGSVMFTGVRYELEYREVARKVAGKRSHPLCMKPCVVLFRNLRNINNMATCIHCDPAVCHALLYGYLHLTKSSQSRGSRDLSDNTSFIQQKLMTPRGKEAYPSLQHRKPASTLTPHPLPLHTNYITSSKCTAITPLWLWH